MYIILGNCDTRRYTYDLIPAVGSKVIFPKSRDIGISYSRMLLLTGLANPVGSRLALRLSGCLKKPISSCFVS